MVFSRSAAPSSKWHTKDAHIFFDFGSEYHPEQPLPDEALQTLVDHRWVPQLRNVYDPRLSYTYHGSEQKDYQETAVFSISCPS